MDVQAIIVTPSFLHPPNTILTTHIVVPVGMWTLSETLIQILTQGGVAEEGNTHHIM